MQPKRKLEAAFANADSDAIKNDLRARTDEAIALGIFGLRLIIQGFIFHKTMNRLGENDLFPWWWLLDIWMLPYYVIFSLSLWKKPRTNWK